MKNANMLQWLFIIALYKLIGFNLRNIGVQLFYLKLSDVCGPVKLQGLERVQKCLYNLFFRACLYVCHFSSIFSTDCFTSTFSLTVGLYSCQGGNLWQKMPKYKFLQAASGWFKLPIATTSMVEEKLEYLGLVSPCKKKLPPLEEIRNT